MSRRAPFEPVRYAKELEASGNFASDNSFIYHWTGTHWNSIDDDTGARDALKWIAANDAGTVNAANAYSAYETAVLWLSRVNEPKDVATIPVQNGYLHFEGGLHLMPHDKSLGLRHVLACDYAPDAPAPNEFNAMIERILPDASVRDRVQEYIGYTLLPDARFQRAQIWLGSGANGKGALANIVQALHKHTAAVQLDKLESFRLAGLVGASLIYCDEAPQRSIHEQAMKSLIAGELFQIDRKYRDAITARVTGKWLILANHIPEVNDQSTGFWRRFDIVPFPVEIPESERDSLLAKRIIAGELPGVLNWALRGLERLLDRGRFDQAIPMAMRSATQDAQMETNSVQAWCHDLNIERTTSVETSKTDVYQNYFSWCRQNGLHPATSPKFWKRLPSSIGAILEGRMFAGSKRIRSCNVKL